MKKTGLFKIIMFILLGIVVASWVFSASYFDEGSLSELGMNNVGLFDYFSLLIKSFSFDYFLQIVFLLLSVGALYGVLEKTGKYRAWINRIVNNYKGREFLFLVVISFMITILTSVFDYGFALFIFFPFIISILLAMGYDKVTVGVATFGATLVGTMGSTIGTNTAGTIANLLSLEVATGFYFKLALLLFGYVIMLLFLSKAKRVRVNEKDLEEDDPYMGENEANKYSLTPVIMTFIVLCLLLVLGCTNWEEAFKVTFFNNLHTKITELVIKLPYFHITTEGVKYGLQDVAVFGKLLGDITAFGTWYYAEMGVMCLFAAFILSRVYKIRYFESMLEGSKKMLKPALMVLLVYTVIYFAGNQMAYPTLAKYMLGWEAKLSAGLKLDSFFTKALLKAINVFGLLIQMFCMALASVMHVDILYVANYAVPQMASMASDTGLVAILGQAMYGVTMFVAPTSAMLVLGLTYLNIPYCEWLKKTWKVAVKLLLLVFLILLLARFI